MKSQNSCSFVSGLGFDQGQTVPHLICCLALSFSFDLNFDLCPFNLCHNMRQYFVERLYSYFCVDDAHTLSWRTGCELMISQQWAHDFSIILFCLATVLELPSSHNNRLWSRIDHEKKILNKMSQLEFICPNCPLASGQGGRSCTGARVAPAERFGLGQKKFSLNTCYFVAN